MDLIAGLTVGLTTVPQALAYAEVAGLPVQVRGRGLALYRLYMLAVYMLSLVSFSSTLPPPPNLYCISTPDFLP